MTRTRKLMAALIAMLMVLAVLPLGALAATVGANAAEAKKLAMLDTAWKSIESVESEAMAKKASPAEVTKAAYIAALNEALVDEGSLVWESDIQFAFTVDGMHCLYYYTARAAQPADNTRGETIVTSYGTKSGNCAGSPNVLLVGPYYSSDSSFTDQYKNEADSIAQATGGTCTKLVDSNATGPAIAANYTDKGVVIYDSHGTQSGTSSYLCLTTNSGITTTDYNNGWAVSSGSAAYIDGRYIQNHASGALSNCLVWMAICEGMKKEGKGTTGTALLAAGAAAVYGYSQSVSFTGDYKYEATFWNEMKNGATMADALVVMKDTWGVPDPVSGGDAYPIVMSPVDPFPSNPDGAQTVNCDWTLFSQDPIALESFEIVNTSGEAISDLTLRQAKSGTVKVLATPANANTYTVEWSIADASIASVAPSANGKQATVTGMNVGSTTLTATVTDEGRAVFTDSVTVNVAEAPKWNPTEVIVPGEEYLIGFIVNGATYLMVNYNESASNHYYYSISSNYYGYTAPAVMNGQSVIGVSGNASDIDYCVWKFSTAQGGSIQSGYESGKYLQAYTSTNYADLYPGSSGTSWTFDAGNKTLYTTVSSTKRYAQYYTSASYDLMGVTSSVPSGSYIQLYSMTAEEPDPSAVYYTVTFVDWDGAVLSSQQVKEGSNATAPQDPTRPGYLFNGWDVDFTNVTSDLTVTATYVEKTDIWVPTDTIVPNKEYLIGFVVDGVTYLAAETNDSGSHYNNVSSTYYGYTAPATMDGENVVDVSGSVTNLDLCKWTFETGTFDGYQIRSSADDSYYLVTWSSASYNDLYTSTGTNFYWNWDASNKTLYRTISGTNRYAQYINVSGNDQMCVTSNVPSNCYVQLFVESVIIPEPTTYYTVTFVDNLVGGTIAEVQVEEGHAAEAPAAPEHPGYSFTGWSADFSNVTSDMTVFALYSINSYTLTIHYVNAEGDAVFDDFTGTFEYGEAYSVISPIVEGYTPDLADVSGTMGAGNVEVTVTYTKDQAGLLGDVNCDGVLSMADISLLSSYILGKGTVPAQGVINADANGDGSVNVLDLPAIYQLYINSI